MACAFILVMLAHGKEQAFARLPEKAAHVLDSAGALAFLLIGWIGVTGGFFFLNVFGRGEMFRLLSSGMILPLNIAIAFKVGSSLFLVFAALAMFRRRSFRSMIEEELS